MSDLRILCWVYTRFVMIIAEQKNHCMMREESLHDETGSILTVSEIKVLVGSETAFQG